MAWRGSRQSASARWRMPDPGAHIQAPLFRRPALSTPVASQLADALSGRYVIERELWRGGMATVFLARDVQHRRMVALMVLDRELGAVLGVERFLWEIETAAGLQHPHILPAFDSGTCGAGGALWYTMPYVEDSTVTVAPKQGRTQWKRAHDAAARLHYGREVRWLRDCDLALQSAREQARQGLQRLDG